jgi:hypothetical protein
LIVYRFCSEKEENLSVVYTWGSDAILTLVNFAVIALMSTWRETIPTKLLYSLAALAAILDADTRKFGLVGLVFLFRNLCLPTSSILETWRHLSSL